jgi:hypothetical protein
VAVAALVTWHVGHDQARGAAAEASIPAHARLETFSVLTRLPAGRRLAPDLVATLIRRWFPARRTLVPTARLSREIVERCQDAGVTGGAVYDALIGLTATEAGLTLLTRDARAKETYRRLAVPFELPRQ